MTIRIEMANRPDPDNEDSWRRLLRRGLASPYLEPGDTSPRQRHFDEEDWVACDACDEKPGAPTLCNGCLANRNTIWRLRAKAGLR